MSRPVLFKGIDVGVPLTNNQCEYLKKSNYKFVCRYYTDCSNSSQLWKLLSKAEAQMISNADLDIIAVYESRDGLSKIYSKETGKKDCINAINCAKEIGQPTNTTIYFAINSRFLEDPAFNYCNTLLNNKYNINIIFNYFTGINEQMKLYKKITGCEGWNLGVYGNYEIIEYMFNKCEILHYWQTLSWSHQKISEKSHFLQNILNTNECGIIPVDIDLAYNSDLGQFKI